MVKPKLLKDVDAGDYIISTKEEVMPSTVPFAPKSKERVPDQEAGMVLKVRKRIQHDNAIVTDGYYFYTVWLRGDEWMPYDLVAAALIEQQYDGALRPSRDSVKWSVTVKREPKMEQGVALEVLTVKTLKPDAGLTITNKAMFPREVLGFLGLRRDATFTYANVTALTQNVKEVSWRRLSSQAVTGDFKIPEFRMNAESLK